MEKGTGLNPRPFSEILGLRGRGDIPKAGNRHGDAAVLEAAACAHQLKGGRSAGDLHGNGNGDDRRVRGGVEGVQHTAAWHVSPVLLEADGDAEGKVYARGGGKDPLEGRHIDSRRVDGKGGAAAGVCDSAAVA